MTSLQQEVKHLREAVEANGISAGTVAATNISATTATVTTLTATAATNLAVTSVAGKDVVLKLGDASGSNKLSIVDTADAEQASINSDGVLSAAIVNTPKINDSNTDATKLYGLYSTYSSATASMYIPVANTSAYERGFKICYAPVVNDGGYFDSLYVNTKVASTSTPDGYLRGLESKVTIEGNCGANAEAHALYAKVNVSGASAEVSKAIGLKVTIEEESSGTVTDGIGVQVDGGTGVMNTGIDVSGVYDVGAINIPYVDGNAAVSIAALESAFGTDNAKQGIIGLYQDNSDAVWLVLGNAKTGKYQKVAATAVDA